MFDLAWSEIALIGVVALVVIGPKDLPGAIRGVAQMLGKARRMAGEFQGHVDEMVREAKLDEVKREIDTFRHNVQDEVMKAAKVDDLKRDLVDPIQQTVRDFERPFDQPPGPAGATPAATTQATTTQATTTQATTTPAGSTQAEATPAGTEAPALAETPPPAATPPITVADAATPPAEPAGAAPPGPARA